MPQKRFGITILFAVIFLLGLSLRSPELLSGNYLFGFDQGQNYMRAYDIAVNHKFTLIGAEVGSGSAGVPGLFHGPGFYYLLALVLLLFKGDPYGGIVFMWTFGVATLIASYITTKKMFGERVALVILFLVSIAPLIAPQSRFVWLPHADSLFVVLCLYFLYKIPQNPAVFTFWATISASLIYHFELANAVPMVALTFVSTLLYRVMSKKVFFSFLAAVVIVFSPMMLFESRHGFMAVKGIIANVTQKKEQSASGKQTPTQDPFHLAQKKQQFISNFRDTFVFESGFIPPRYYNLTLTLIAILSIGTIVLLGDNRTKRYVGILGSAIPLTYAIFLPLRGNIWPYYLGHLHFVYIYIVAIATVLIVRNVQKRSWIWMVALLPLVFFYCSVTQGALKRVQSNWLVDYRDYGGKDKILGKRAAIDYVYADARGAPFNVLVFMPPVYTWPYDYLFLTYAKQKYGYVPGQEKKGTVYLIIERDGEKYWSYKGWLETVIKDGTVIWERELKQSDQLIQKRIFE